MSTHTTTSPIKRSYKRISVRRKDATGYTSVSMSPREWEQALGYTGGHERRATDAVRHIAKHLDAADVLPGDFSLVVRRKALARLRGQVRNASAQLAAENNDAWGAQ
ncbi:hypothetical protein Q5W_15480 [Hydrogenophaga sp. PBC]|uniref:hypothetical protein n=1 Tax=Hydrogenophaga sp. PBC TaxID=795665 RepID=UPI0002606A47|nr:hypothetical protein [Hydrogenophaga sp. PBC]AOS80271.1 hypothetical protein Q5W_15480 [Hydrogenophaga sp. PBC]